VALLLVACSDDPAADATPTSGPPVTAAGPPPTTRDGAPPRAFNDLLAIFQPTLDGLGLQLTRAAVNDFEPGPHLALYVVPKSADDANAQAYLDRVIPLVAALEPLLFDAYPALHSFDICQEPLQAAGRPVDFPPPETLLLMDESQLDAVDWTTATIADVLAAVDDGGELDVSPEISRLADWRDAQEAT
jgi:hypothetical protein